MKCTLCSKGRHCLFRHIWFRQAERHDPFSSVSRSWLVKLGVGGPGAVRGGPPDGRSVKRQRRSEEVNPSDPLRTESHPSPPVKDVEPNQAGAVSKETITSCDDPLRVLRPNGHGSPRIAAGVSPSCSPPHAVRR
uniref:Uncharacterized protein n=1 Tax=Poecilia reticulata TaxID=8081 RepID=A0A3P9MWT2_POERE